MSVFFNRVERVNPQHPGTPKRWYAVLKVVNQVAEKEVAKMISDETTLNRKEAEMALDQLEKVLINLLLESHSVQLGDWGSFHLTCNSQGHDTREEVTADSITKLNIRFTPGKQLREAIAGANFVPAESLVSK
ncbi:MAG: HU family DNA-binding protein [Odoribacteraceae bacterium]|jgi:predicted histone-like DNA-binding protein|nr:HU family DNA-binding protein [Odoribacteraceae bacterium]